MLSMSPFRPSMDKSKLTLSKTRITQIAVGMVAAVYVSVRFLGGGSTSRSADWQGISLGAAFSLPIFCEKVPFLSIFDALSWERDRH